MLSLVSLILPSFCALRSGGQLRLFQRTSICHPEDEAAGHSILDWLHERSQNRSGVYCNFCVHLLLANQQCIGNAKGLLTRKTCKLSF